MGIERRVGLEAGVPIRRVSGLSTRTIYRHSPLYSNEVVESRKARARSIHTRTQPSGEAKYECHFVTGEKVPRGSRAKPLSHHTPPFSTVINKQSLRPPAADSADLHQQKKRKEKKKKKKKRKEKKQFDSAV